MNAFQFILGMFISIVITGFFDRIRDKYGKCHCDSIGDSSTVIKMLDANWKVVLMSYNYALFYGRVFSYLFFLVENYINNDCGLSSKVNIVFANENSLLFFIFIAFIQRIMCALVMPNIHRKASPIVHAIYYTLYYIGAMWYIYDVNNNYDVTEYVSNDIGQLNKLILSRFAVLHMIEFMLFGLISVAFSLINIYTSDCQLNYDWRNQYVNGKKNNVDEKNRNNLNYQQLYTKFEYYHLRVILIMNILSVFV